MGKHVGGGCYGIDSCRAAKEPSENPMARLAIRELLPVDSKQNLLAHAGLRSSQEAAGTASFERIWIAVTPSGCSKVTQAAIQGRISTYFSFQFEVTYISLS